MNKIIMILTFLSVSTFANIINSNYINKNNKNQSCNLSYDPSNNNFKYNCKNLQVSEIILKDVNGFSIASSKTYRHFKGYGTFKNVNGNPYTISCYIKLNNTTVEIVDLNYITSSSTPKANNVKIDKNKYPKQDKKGNYYRVVNSTRIYYPN